jgi:hypothetical protein
VKGDRDRTEPGAWAWIEQGNRKRLRLTLQLFVVEDRDNNLLARCAASGLAADVLTVELVGTPDDRPVQACGGSMSVFIT